MVAPRLHQRSNLARQLGVELSPPNPMLEDAVVTDAFQRSTVPGVFVAGDVSGDKQQVATAVAAGSMTAVMVVQSLVSEDFGLPLPPAMAE